MFLDAAAMFIFYVPRAYDIDNYTCIKYATFVKSFIRTGRIFEEIERERRDEIFIKIFYSLSLFILYFVSIKDLGLGFLSTVFLPSHYRNLLSVINIICP